MRWSISVLSVLLGLLPVRECLAEVVLRDGVIEYTGTDGQHHQIPARKKCLDLWVSPDESIIAFVVAEEVSPAHSVSDEVFVERSSVYVARKKDNYAPVSIVDRAVRIAGRPWQVFRNPRLAPGLDDLYFEVPYTMTTSKLFRIRVGDGVLSECAWPPG